MKIFYFELKKILKRRLNIAAMLVGYAFMLFYGSHAVKSCSHYDEASKTYVTGISSLQLMEQKSSAWTTYLTEEYLWGLTKDIQEKNADLDTDEGYRQIIRPMNDLLWVAASNYMDVGEAVRWNVLNEIPTEKGIHFYERRREKAAAYLNRDFSYGNYSQEEINYWMEKTENVQIPFLWGDKTVMDIVWDTIMRAFLLLFIVVICIAPIFASEYESSAAALLLTTKNGKSKLIAAKTAAAVLFALMYVLIGISAVVAIEGITVGFPGAALPVQLWEPSIPYDWNAGTVCAVTLLVMLLVTLAMTLFTVLLSARLKGSMVTLAIGFAILIGPVFLPMSNSSRWWNQVNYLFPFKAVSVKDVISNFNSYQFGPVVISYLGMIVIVYIIITVISLLGIKNGFAKHQVRN